MSGSYKHGWYGLEKQDWVHSDWFYVHVWIQGSYTNSCRKERDHLCLTCCVLPEGGMRPVRRLVKSFTTYNFLNNSKVHSCTMKRFLFGDGETMLDVRFSQRWLWRVLSPSWDIGQCSPLKGNRHFGGTCPHIQGWRVRQARTQHEAGRNHGWTES
jgi:hypothetical protein